MMILSINLIAENLFVILGKMVILTTAHEQNFGNIIKVAFCLYCKDELNKDGHLLAKLEQALFRFENFSRLNGQLVDGYGFS